MKKNQLMTITAAAVILLSITGCSSLIRQSPPRQPQKNAAPRTAQQAPRTQPRAAAAPKELTAAQIVAMTPEQLKKYHAERQKAREQEDLERRKRAQYNTTIKEDKAKPTLESFMYDRPSREKRRRLGDVSRQLNYSETSVFPWRQERRSETLKRR